VESGYVSMSGDDVLSLKIDDAFHHCRQIDGFVGVCGTDLCPRKLNDSYGFSYEDDALIPGFLLCLLASPSCPTGAGIDDGHVLWHHSQRKTKLGPVIVAFVPWLPFLPSASMQRYDCRFPL
jgi:hypothetical protein